MNPVRIIFVTGSLHLLSPLERDATRSRRMKFIVITGNCPEKTNTPMIMGVYWLIRVFWSIASDDP